MKKILLSSVLVGAFVFYVVWQRLSGSQTGLSTVSNSTPSDNSKSTPSGNLKSTPNGNSNTPSSVVYKDGQYVGNAADAYYGNVQVKVVIKNGKITDVQFLDHPQDRNTSVMINNQAMPILKTEAIRAQSARVDIVSGATDTSQAFRQSLSSALKQAV